MSGNMVDSQEAYRIGLVNKIVPKSELIAESEKLLQIILAKGPYAVSMIIEAVNEGLDKKLSSALEHEANLFGQTCATDDMHEGTIAFLEKRKPDFTSK